MIGSKTQNLKSKMIAIKPLYVLAVDFGEQHGGEVFINVYSESKCYIATLAK